MSSVEYEVIWDGSHRNDNADLLITTASAPAAPERPIAPRGKPEVTSTGSKRVIVYMFKGKTPVVRNGPICEVYCLECGQLFRQRFQSEGRVLGGRKFCGRKCSTIWHRRQARERIPQATWRIGRTDEEIEQMLAETRSRMELRKATPDTQPCEVCGTMKNVHRHHKDHNPFNNVLTNIAWLCSPHHHALHARERADEQPF